MLNRGSYVLNLCAVACAPRIFLSFPAISVVLPRNAVAVYRLQNIARRKLDIGRRPLVIGRAKANKISRLPSAVFVCLFRSALIAEVAGGVKYFV